MKRLLNILIFIFIFIILNLVPINAEQIDNLFLDDITKQYINEKITDDLTFINSKYNFDFIQVNKNGIGNPINEIKANVYSFKYVENNENKSYSFITIEFPKI